MSRIFFDSNLFIYLVEDELGTGIKVDQLLERMQLRGDQLFTSSFTIGEVLVRPIEENNQVLVAKFQSLFRSSDVNIILFDEKAALEYAVIRQDRSIRAPDTIQLACASAAKCDFFVTNDERLSRRIVSGIQAIVSLDRVPI